MTDSGKAEVIDCVNSLVEACIDGANGLREAAGHVRDLEVREVFVQGTAQRERFGRELQREVVRLGGTAAQSGSVTGKVHQWWIDLKSRLGAGDAGILAAAECGEDAAVKEYESAIARLPAGESRSLAERQLREVRSTHDRVRALRDRYQSQE